MCHVFCSNVFSRTLYGGSLGKVEGKSIDELG